MQCQGGIIKMANIIGSPTRYIQGKRELKNLAVHVSNIGKNLFILRKTGDTS